MNVAEEETRRIVIDGESDDIPHRLESDRLHGTVAVQLGKHLERVDFGGFGVEEERVEILAGDAVGRHLAVGALADALLLAAHQAEFAAVAVIPVDVPPGTGRVVIPRLTRSPVEFDIFERVTQIRFE